MLKQPLGVLPMFIVMLLQAGVSLDRISDFLKEDDVPDYVSTFKRQVVTSSAKDDDEEIGILGASFAWNQVKETEKEAPKKDPPPPSEHQPEEEETESSFELRDINVMFPVGKLSLVVGPTASGKSALLLALLGEMTMLEDTTVDPLSVIRLPKNPQQLDRKSGLYNAMSYCAQTPWLEHATIKQNILFNSPLEEDRYQEVIRACELLTDLTILEDGDETEIGARGVSLSGGQKARVALARAVYSRTKHVILDDPLAAGMNTELHRLRS
jgi:ABC-type multidrug transport system fused ATPase/permease subunit